MQRSKLWIVALRFVALRFVALRFVTVSVAFGLSAHAQNTFPASGNVGIGTTSPQYSLDVNGTIGMRGRPAFDSTTLSIPSDGTYVIASGGRIHGEYIVAWESPNRVQTVHLLVNANQYDPGPQIQILENHSYNQAAVMSNFRLLLSADSSQEYLVMTVGNRSGGTSASVQYQGAAMYGASFGGTLVGNETPVGSVGLVSTEGNVGIGTTNPGAKLEVNGSVMLTANSGASITFPDATIQATAWNGVLSGGDYAESVNVSGDREEYEPGDVMVIDPAAEGNFLKSSAPYSTAVTGIYSTRPGAVGRRQRTARTHMKDEVPMAMTGIVPTKVSAENGPIRPGDLLVTSSRAGYAMKGTDRTKMLGAVIGKAIGHLDSGVGVVEAVVTLQ